MLLAKELVAGRGRWLERGGGDCFKLNGKILGEGDSVIGGLDALAVRVLGCC